MNIVTLVLLVVIVLWALGYFPRASPFAGNNLLHALLILVAIIVIYMIATGRRLF